MGQIKALNIDWLHEAWKLSDLLARLPSASGAPIDSQSLAARYIDALQTMIALHLAYRLRMVHKFTNYVDGKKGMFVTEDRNPAAFSKSYAMLGNMGVKFTTADAWAIDAYTKLSHVLIDGFVCDKWKRTLPLMVASISGNSASKSAASTASKPRPGRKNRNAELRDAKSFRLRNNPGENWKETLQHLQGDGCVIDWTDRVITWRTNEGVTHTTKTSTFRGWLKER